VAKHFLATDWHRLALILEMGVEPEKARFIGFEGWSGFLAVIVPKGPLRGKQRTK
jgi:hypothetical protein